MPQVTGHRQMVCSEAEVGKGVGDALMNLSLGATGRGCGLDAQAHFVAQIGQGDDPERVGSEIVAEALGDIGRCALDFDLVQRDGRRKKLVKPVAITTGKLAVSASYQCTEPHHYCEKQLLDQALHY